MAHEPPTLSRELASPTHLSPDPKVPAHLIVCHKMQNYSMPFVKIIGSFFTWDILMEIQVVEVVQPAKTPFPAPLEEGLASDIYSKFLALTPGEEEEEEEEEEATKEPERVLAEAPAEEQGTVDPLMGYTIEDVRLLLGQLTNDLISNIQVGLQEAAGLNSAFMLGATAGIDLELGWGKASSAVCIAEGLQNLSNLLRLTSYQHVQFDFRASPTWEGALRMTFCVGNLLE
ncbi:hypothetical protein E2320_008157, partial [Naja naja]